MGESYEAAGVSIATGDQAVSRIKEMVRSTYRQEVIGDIGGFGGLFALQADRYREPVLVSATDGVGTKAMVAQALGRFETIGIDLVAMCVDDLVCQGAEPLLFLDYISVGSLDPDHVAKLVSGVAEGCRQAGCALVGGEMAEHPGAMKPGEFDLVGFAMGAVERDQILSSEMVQAQDVLIGLSSPGLRSNGYSLARRVLLELAALPLDGPAWEGADHSLGDELLKPSVIYSPAIHSVLAGGIEIHSIAHITGGGIPGNLVRVLPKDLDVLINSGTWAIPPIFGEIQRLGDVSDDEMAKVFNMGIGMIVVVASHDGDRAVEFFDAAGLQATKIGEVIKGSGQVLTQQKSLGS